MYTEKFIQKALLRKFSSHRYKFTNVFYFNNESDFISFLPSGFCYEIEVKISKSDFMADFKKPRHEIRNKNNIGQKYYIEKVSEYGYRQREPSWEFCKHFPELVLAEESRSYRKRGEMEINLSYTSFSQINFREINNLQIPNKFFYAVPKGLINLNDVPDYAGLLFIDEFGNVEKIKDGKFIHKDLLNPVKLFDKCYYSYERELTQKLK